MPPPAAGPPPRLEQELGARLRRLGDAFQQAHELQVGRHHLFLGGGWGGTTFEGSISLWGGGTTLWGAPPY